MTGCARHNRYKKQTGLYWCLSLEGYRGLWIRRVKQDIHETYYRRRSRCDVMKYVWWDEVRVVRCRCYLEGLVHGRWRCPCASVMRNSGDRTYRRPSRSCSGSSSFQSAWLSECRCSPLCWWGIRILVVSLWLLSSTSKRRSPRVAGTEGHVLFTQSQSQLDEVIAHWGKEEESAYLAR